MLDSVKILLAFAVLFLVCTIYAIVLDQHTDWYADNNRTWITVVIGNAFIGVALYAIELWGIPLRIGHVVLANAAAGAPIIIWQLIRGAANRAERRASKDK